MPHHKTFNQAIVSLWSHLKRPRKIQFAVLLALMMLASMAEMISIGAVVPFLGALINPEQVFNHPSAQPTLAFFGIRHVNVIIDIN